MPKSCPEVPSEILNPKNTWNDKKAYNKKANILAKVIKVFPSHYTLFVENYQLMIQYINLSYHHLKKNIKKLIILVVLQSIKIIYM